MRPSLDVLVVGAGPAGLATAIKLKRLADEAGQELSMAVIDKAPQPGHHNLSGAVLDPRPLDELTPGWREHRLLAKRISVVEQDDMFFLLGSRAIRIPAVAAPDAMDHSDDVIISISRLVGFLAAVAEEEGIEVYNGFSARQLIIEDGRVEGVRLGQVGLDAAGGHMANYRPAEEIRARVTVLADGTRGVLSEQLREHFGAGLDPQAYSLGVKAVMQFKAEHPFGAGRVAHFLGYPLPQDVFGGGFMYAMDEKTVAVGLIMALDWKYGDLNPQQEFERFRAHPFVAQQLEGGVTIASGARTIPEGGYYAIGKVNVPGALVVGDGAGLVNMEKIKGIHNAMWSGMAAAETIAAGLARLMTGRSSSRATRLASRSPACCLRCATRATTARPSSGACTWVRRCRRSRTCCRCAWAWSPTARAPALVRGSTASPRAAWTAPPSSASPAPYTERTRRPIWSSPTPRSAARARTTSRLHVNPSVPARSTAGTASRWS